MSKGTLGAWGSVAERDCQCYCVAERDSQCYCVPGRDCQCYCPLPPLPPSTSLSIIHKNVRLHVCCRFAAQYGLFRPAAWPFRAFVSARAVLACGPALQAGAPSLAFFTTNPFSAACRGHCQGSVCLAAAMTQQVRPPRNCPRQAHLLRIASACLSLQGVRRAGRRHWCRRLPSRMQTGRRRLRHSVPAGTMPVPHLRRLRPWLLSAAAVPLG